MMARPKPRVFKIARNVWACQYYDDRRWDIYLTPNLYRQEFTEWAAAVKFALALNPRHIGDGPHP